MRAVIHRLRNAFVREEDGAVLAETIIVVPFVTIFAAGILEFGNMFWQKEQMEVGLRDAARFIARCQQSGSFEAACGKFKLEEGEVVPDEGVVGESVARNIAFYGTASPAANDLLRVPGWGLAAGDMVVTEPTPGVIRVEASKSYSFILNRVALRIPAVTIQAYHEQRYIGW